MQLWGTDLFNFNIPSQISKHLTSQSIPQIFGDYDIDPSFLSNFWATMVILTTTFVTWLLCKGIVISLQTTKNAYIKWICNLLRQICRALSNFLLVNIYVSFGDIVFFSVLEIQSRTFNSAWSYVSFSLAVIFLLFALCLSIVYARFLIKYQALKPKLSESMSLEFDRFTKKYQIFQALYEGYSEESLFRHGFMLIMIIRDISVSLVITAMISFPLIQSILLTLCSIFVCLFLAFNNPFQHRFEQLKQLALEFCVFTVNVCVLIFAILDSTAKTAIQHRERLGSAVIILNNMMLWGSLFLASLKMLQVTIAACRIYSKKRKQRVQVLSNIPAVNDSSLSPIHNSAIGEKSSIDISFQNPRRMPNRRENAEIYLQQPEPEYIQQQQPFENRPANVNNYVDTNRKSIFETQKPFESRMKPLASQKANFTASPPLMDIYRNNGKSSRKTDNSEMIVLQQDNPFGGNDFVDSQPLRVPAERHQTAIQLNMDQHNQQHEQELTTVRRRKIKRVRHETQVPQTNKN